MENYRCQVLAVVPAHHALHVCAGIDRPISAGALWINFLESTRKGLVFAIEDEAPRS